MKKIFIYFFINLLLFSFCKSPSSLQKESVQKRGMNQYILHGFKIGQNMENVIEELGKPSKIHKFPDGFIAAIYFKENYNLIFEVNNVRNDLIWAIQVSGKSVPKEYHVPGLIIGESKEETVDIYGKPDAEKIAVDEITKKELPGNLFYSYFNNANFSLEFKDNKLFGVKLIYKETNPEKYPTNPDPFEFIEAAKRKDYYSLTFQSFLHLEIVAKGKRHYPRKSFYSFFKQPEINSLLVEIGDLQKSDLKKTDYRVTEEGPGTVFKFEKSGKEYQLFFIKSFEGWVLHNVLVR